MLRDEEDSTRGPSRQTNVTNLIDKDLSSNDNL